MTRVVAKLVDRDTNRPGLGPVVYLIEESGGRLWFRREGQPVTDSSEIVSIPCDDSNAVNLEVVAP